MPAVVAPYHHEDRPSCVECLVSSFNVMFHISGAVRSDSLSQFLHDANKRLKMTPADEDGWWRGQLLL